MICPKCKKQPITFLKFFLNLSLKDIKCKNCGAKLKPGKLLRMNIYSGYAFGLILLLLTMLLENFYGWEFYNALLFCFLILIIVGIPAEYFFWTRGNFEEKID